MVTWQVFKGKSRYGTAILFVLAGCLSLVCTYQTKAQTAVLDPQIFFCNEGPCTSAPGGTAIGGESNLITNTDAFFVGVSGGNNENIVLQSPLLIIVGVYNGSGTPSVSYSGCAVPLACPAATVGTYGLTANTNTLVTGQGAYDQLGLASGGSQTFDNWSTADQLNGFAAPNSFTLYAFALPASLTSSLPITIDESGAAFGSFIIGYSCNFGSGTPGAACDNPGDIGQTPMTNGGLITNTPPVPEPTSMLLFGTGLVALGAKLRRRKV